METLEYRFAELDKTKWGDGPWVDEPDKLQWQDEATGLPCIAKRNAHLGNWCGYVGVTKGHPAFDYPDPYEFPADVHGSITYGSRCQPHEPGYNGEAHAICHIVQDGEDDEVFWLGFDCGHSMDYQPALAEMLSSEFMPVDGYKTLGYVKAQCASLASQLAEMAA